MIAAVKPTDPGEFIRSIELGLAGFDLSMDPRNWRDYAAVSSVAWDKGRPLSLLVAKYPEAAGQIALVAQKGGQSMDGLRFLPLVAQRVRWRSRACRPVYHEAV